ncbi:MAG: MBL fold metallo-hydrolase [Oscillospiraceae bacterium]
MSRKATEFQKKEMSKMYRGKEIFKPLQTGWIDEHVACVREWVANIFFYRKGDTTLMFDAGYNYDRLEEKMGWLGIDPKSIRQIFITHQDTDHVGAVEADSPGLFRDAVLYVGETENRYLTGEVRRKVIYHLYKLPQVTIRNEKVLLKDGDVLDIDGIRVEGFLVPGHTWGHMVYLVDDKYLFTGDTIWFGADGGYSFISALAEDNKLAVRSLAELEAKLQARGLHPYFITGHTGWTDDFAFAFANKDKLCSPFGKRVHDSSAPYDAYDESDDTEQRAKSGFLKPVSRYKESGLTENRKPVKARAFCAGKRGKGHAGLRVRQRDVDPAGIRGLEAALAVIRGKGSDEAFTSSSNTAVSVRTEGGGIFSRQSVSQKPSRSAGEN